MLNDGLNGLLNDGRIGLLSQYSRLFSDNWLLNDRSSKRFRGRFLNSGCNGLLNSRSRLDLLLCLRLSRGLLRYGFRGSRCFLDGRGCLDLRLGDRCGFFSNNNRGGLRFSGKGCDLGLGYENCSEFTEDLFG